LTRPHETVLMQAWPSLLLRTKMYLKALDHISAVEVVAHRVLWSIPIAGLVLYLMGRTDDIGRILKDPKSLVMGCITAALVSINWGVYVWAIAAERTLDGALGYPS